MPVMRGRALAKYPALHSPLARTVLCSECLSSCYPKTGTDRVQTLNHFGILLHESIEDYTFANQQRNCRSNSQSCLQQNLGSTGTTSEQAIINQPGIAWRSHC